MASTIKIKNSSTTGAVPSASDLVQGELAVNVTDTGLYTENASGTVVKLNAPSIDDKNTGATKHVTISTAGNVGVGVTPSAWSSFRAMDLQYNGSVQSYSSGGLALGYNAYFSGGWIAKSTGSSCKFNLDSNGGFSWQQNASVIGESTFTYNTAMTLDASGRLLLGTTTAAYTSSGRQNLAVSGSSQAAYEFQVGGTGVGYLIGTSSNVEFGATGFINFVTNGQERARIDTGGNLLVGNTSNPYGSRLVATKDDDTGPSADFYRAGTGVSSAVVTYCSNVGGTRALKSYIDTAGALISTSDARLKENVKAFDAGLDCVLGLNPVYFSWKGDASTQAGFIAQEVEQVLPIAVREMQSNGLEDMRTLDKNVLFPVLVKAIQEQQAIIESLTARITALEQA